jgi:hypothetical protein
MLMLALAVPAIALCTPWNKERRRVIVIVLRILSDDGFLNIQLGQAGSFPPVF